MVISAVGNAVAGATTNTGARFFAMFLMPIGAVPACKAPDLGFPMLRTCATRLTGFVRADMITVSWIANSFPRPSVKRSACIAIPNMIGNTATIYGSYMYPISDDPLYTPGNSASAGLCILTALLALVLRYAHVWENKKLEQAEQEAELAAEVGGKVPEDVTQRRRAPGFRYNL